MLQLLEPQRPPAPLSLDPSYVKGLERDLLALGGRRKRDRTRARLFWATALVLDNASYDQARVADIAAAAGVSAGAFYVYFVDRGDAAHQVLNRFIEHLFSLDGFPPATGREALRKAIADQLVLAKANAGLIRALSQAMAASPGLGDLLARRCAAWVRRANLLAAGPDDLESNVQAAHEALMDGALRRLALRRVSEVELQGLAEAMTHIWCARLGADAAPERLN